MKLERYNQILWAVLGTALGLGAIALAVALALSNSHHYEEQKIVIAEPGKPKPLQDLVFCEPVVIPGANRELFPVAAVNVKNPDSNKITMSNPLVGQEMYSISSSRSSLLNCNLSSYGMSHVLDVIVRDTKSGDQKSLLGRPAQIDSLVMPDKNCKERQGPLPCGLLQWTIRDRDTNHDGVIDSDDASVIFISDMQITKLTAVTPPDANATHFVWDSDHNALLYRVQIDTDKNGRFEGGDATDILEYSIGSGAPAQPVISETIRKALLSRLQ